uniref:putative nuclease HARBI1 n=1 Tax=Osmia lignaria TaxID=473952 RepID=UPI001478FEF6|nr:putative nuclease HARBI1 [Osmia lignaria]
MQLLICLRYYATASFQLILGNTMNVSQPTVSRIVFRVSSLIGSLMTDYIKFPRDSDNSTQNRRLFNHLGQGNGAIGLPGVDGAIDCAHIRLTASRFNNMEEMYRNRKGYFSLNVQVRGLTTKFLCSTTTVVVLLVEGDEIENQNEDGEELLGNVENVNGIDGFATREALIACTFH